MRLRRAAALLLALLAAGVAAAEARRPAEQTRGGRGEFGKAADAVLRGLDEDGDGQLGRAEIREFVEDVGGASLDEVTEIEEGVMAVLRNVDANEDRVVSSADLRVFWERMSSLLTADEVADWIAHGVQLPQYAAKLREHSITGQDLAALIDDDDDDEAGVVAFLERELAMSTFHRRQIARAIRMRLLGVGAPPEPPSAIIWAPRDCSSVLLQWLSPPAAGSTLPAHKYQLQRREAGRERHPWETVWEGAETSVVDDDLEPLKLYDYRLRAWNLLGPSPSVSVRQCHAVQHGCHAPSSSVTLFMAGLTSTVSTVLQLGATVLAIFGAWLRVRRGQGAAQSTLFEQTLRWLPFLPVQGDKPSPASPAPPRRATSGNVDETAAATAAATGARGLEELRARNPMPAAHPALREQRESMDAEDPYLFCARCNKKFSWRRRRHHCSVCTALFCQHHGHTPHAPLTACGIPGKCVCDGCYPAVRERKLRRGSSASASLPLPPPPAPVPRVVGPAATPDDASPEDVWLPQVDAPSPPSSEPSSEPDLDTVSEGASPRRSFRRRLSFSRRKLGRLKSA